VYHWCSLFDYSDFNVFFFKIDNPHIRNDGLLSDYCDGDIFRRHPLFSRDPKALQLILYFDEFQVCNPLGSRANRVIIY